MNDVPIDIGRFAGPIAGERLMRDRFQLVGRQAGVDPQHRERVGQPLQVVPQAERLTADGARDLERHVARGERGVVDRQPRLVLGHKSATQIDDPP